MSVLDASIERSRSRAVWARDNLVVKKGNMWHPKVCCVCDRHIIYGEEAQLNIDIFKKAAVRGVLSKTSVDLSDYFLPDDAIRRIKDYYTIDCYPRTQRNTKFLRELYLSPRSYLSDPKKDVLGCCLACKNAITGISSATDPKPPRDAIANGLMIGQPPPELTDLTIIELAMISLARIDKHVFSVQAGAHSAITGWHTMYANDVSSVMNAANWCVNNVDDGDDGDESEEDEESIHDRNDNDQIGEPVMIGENGDESVDHDVRESSRPRLAKVCVILSGPFTSTQKAIARQKTEVSWERIRNALLWLKVNNKVYRDEDITADKVREPIVLESINEVESESSNIERVFEMQAVFPDGSNITSETGGCSTRKGFKEITMDKMIAESDDRGLACISRPTVNILRDYQGNNLMKAFPLQFPYGIGSRKANGDMRTGVGYYKHISYLSQPHFHTPEFVCVLHNMFERQRMVANSFLRNTSKQCSSYTGLTNDVISDAVDRFTQGVSGSTTGDLFLNKMRAVTSSMAHTNEAAKRARVNIFAMVARFGLPSLMFTITPVDDMSIRLLIYHNAEDGAGPPPHQLSEESTKREFILSMRKICKSYPGLAAIEFENIYKIVIECILGWDMKSGKAIEGVGVFGKVIAFCGAAEEQGRCSLHSHILVMLEDWAKLYEGLGHANDRVRRTFETQLVNFAKKVMTPNVLGTDESKIVRPCRETCPSYRKCVTGMTKVSHQDIRNLRLRKGTTELGDKAILKCQDCQNCYTSEDLIIQKLISIFGEDKISQNGVRPSYNDGFWEKNLQVTKPFVEMELRLMNSTLPFQNGQRRASDRVNVHPSLRACVAISRNVHKTMHVRQCFKKDKNGECRMKHPQLPEESSKVIFDEEPKKWFQWRGRNEQRKLYTYSPERGYADMFGNVYNQVMSDVFCCNNNVVACVDGGSPMYATCYHSKNTQKEDSEKVGMAAKHMVKRMNEWLEHESSGDFTEQHNDGETIVTNDGSDENEDSAGEPDTTAMGLKAMIGAVLMSTNAHICGAPMAAYLTRNESRFKYSHDTAYVNLKDFLRDPDSDYELGSNEQGTPFIKSQVANYIMRPTALEDVCLYDFLSHYSVARKQRNSLEWQGEHPSKDHLAVKPLKEGFRIPQITYRDFKDTKHFEGEDLIQCEIPETTQARHHAMEEYSQSACLCFIPFRKVTEELQTDGSFHKKFQQYVRDGRLSELHMNILQNMQNCYNSLNAGRPKDALERRTQTPKCAANQDDRVQEEENDEEDLTDEAIGEILENSTNLESFQCPKFRNRHGLLAFSTDQTTAFGRHQCGSKMLICPVISDADESSVVTFQAGGTHDDANEEMEGNSQDTQKTHRNLTPLDLHTLSLRRKDRFVDPAADNMNLPVPTGTLENVLETSQILFGDDEDQRTAFEHMVISFILKLHKKAKFNEVNPDWPETKRRRFNKIQSDLQQVVREPQLVCFLSGGGGCGKSHVLKSYVRYCKQLCNNLKISFDSFTVVVTALTGAAAIEINGQTSAKALCFKRQVNAEDVENWQDTYSAIMDEVSFAKRNEIECGNSKMCNLKENHDHVFGGCDMIFSGDMSQLAPVRSMPIYLEKDFNLWDEYVTLFFELKTSHRFKNDPAWGKLLHRFRDVGPTVADVKKINGRVLNAKGGPKEDEIPPEAVYATKTNLDRMAINDGIFLRHLKATHSTDPTVDPPLHTICIKAGDLKWRKNRKEFVKFNNNTRDIFYSCVGEAQLKSMNESKTFDPMLKLFYKRPVMMNENIKVENGEANGTMCEFYGVSFKRGVTQSDLEKVVIDGFYVWCTHISQVESLKLRLLDGLSHKGEVKYVNLKPQPIVGKAHFPIPIYNEINKSTVRFWRGMKMIQFPLVCANARTIHKLQGRSIDYLVISNWCYTGNWVYVALSRTKELKGLFLRIALDHGKCRGMSNEVKQFLEKMRKKVPGPRNYDARST